MPLSRHMTPLLQLVDALLESTDPVYSIVDDVDCPTTPHRPRRDPRPARAALRAARPARRDRRARGGRADAPARPGCCSRPHPPAARSRVDGHVLTDAERLMIKETGELAAALDVAAARWPDVTSRRELLLRLVEQGPRRDRTRSRRGDRAATGRRSTTRAANAHGLLTSQATSSACATTGRRLERLKAHARSRFACSPITLAEVLVGPVRAGPARRGSAGGRDAGPARDRATGRRPPAGSATLRAETGLRLPDCCVLLAAEPSRAPIVSFDERLVSAAEQRGLITGLTAYAGDMPAVDPRPLLGEPLPLDLINTTWIVRRRAAARPAPRRGRRPDLPRRARVRRAGGRRGPPRPAGHARGAARAAGRSDLADGPPGVNAVLERGGQRPLLGPAASRWRSTR